MPRKSDILKAVNPRRSRSKAKVIEWEPRAYSRGIRDVPVEVGAMESQPKPKKKAGRRPRAENNDTLQGETAPQSMDVDETPWAEPVIPAREKRVRQHTSPSSMSLTYLPVSAYLH
jgi:hypothetical protein